MKFLVGLLLGIVLGYMVAYFFPISDYREVQPAEPVDVELGVDEINNV